MYKNNIKLLQKNLTKVVQAINEHNNEIWFRIYPPASIERDCKKRVNDKKLINEIDKTKEFVLYINIPFCNNKCDYCGLQGGLNVHKIGSQKYLNCLKSELAELIRIRKKRKILGLLLGGGTPSLLAPQDLKNLMNYIRRNFLLLKNVQFCMEAAPADINKSMAEAIVKSGINRICLGVQTFNEKKLRSCNRYFQKNVDVYRAVRNLRRAGSKNISFDLIYGLKPKESAWEFLKDNMEHILKLKPDDVSLFALQNYQKFPETVYNFFSQDLRIANRIITSELGRKAGSPLSDSQYFFLRRVLLKDVLAIGVGAKGDYWRNGQYIERINRNDLRHIADYQQDVEKNCLKYDYSILSKERSLRKYIIHGLNRYGIYESVVKQKFPQSLKLFYKIISNIKDVLDFSNGIYQLKYDYKKILPFITRNEHVNYFIFCFCYLYSESDQKILLKASKCD